MRTRQLPTLNPERQLWSRGAAVVAGVDEAGVGPLAGPVVAAAVIFEPEVSIAGVDDSKRLTAKCRETLFAEIGRLALAIGIGQAEPAEIDKIDILRATFAACRRAIGALSVRPDHVLVDGRPIPELGIGQSALVGGDRTSFCIAAASVVAKVTRDRLMQHYDRLFPVYGFARHKGYGTRAHLEALASFGPCVIHRQSFAPVRDAARAHERR